MSTISRNHLPFSLTSAVRGKISPRSYLGQNCLMCWKEIDILSLSSFRMQRHCKWNRVGLSSRGRFVVSNFLMMHDLKVCFFFNCNANFYRIRTSIITTIRQLYKARYVIDIRNFIHIIYAFVSLFVVNCVLLMIVFESKDNLPEKNLLCVQNETRMAIQRVAYCAIRYKIANDFNTAPP